MRTDDRGAEGTKGSEGQAGARMGVKTLRQRERGIFMQGNGGQDAAWSEVGGAGTGPRA